jgi:2-dehydro-3-deoxy-D-gluconate 5-dehydrogenase
MILDKFRLDGKTALVTGSSRGIGMAVAAALAEAGADIIGVSASFEKTESQLEGMVISAGRKFKSYLADFSDRKSLYSFIEQVKDDKIDILVNNAGTIMRSPAAEHSDEYWDKVIEVNLNSQFILTREIGKCMLNRGYGKIIFTASLLSFQGGITVPGYAASKSGIAALIKALANEWTSKGVCVNGIAPGYIETDNTEALRKDSERFNAINSRIPAGRWGTPDDLKGAYVFLASEASDYISGAILTVDGGWMGR